MEDLKRNKSIYLIIPALVLLVLVIIVKFANKDKEGTKQSNATFITPKVNDGRDTIKNLSDVYRKSQEVENNETEKKRQSLTPEQIQELINKKKNSESSNTEVGFDQEISFNQDKQVQTSTVSSKNEVRSPTFQNTKKITKQVNSSTTTKPMPTEEYSGMGIYIAKSNRQSKTGTINSSENFIPAILEDNTRIRQNSSVIFILQEDVSIDNINFKKGSIIYTTAMEGNYSFDVVSNYIQNAVDDRKYPVKLILYNENYTRGITYDGNINKAVKEGNRETMQDIANENLYGNDIVTDAATSLVKSTVRNLNRDLVASRFQGYRVYFKKLKE